MGGGKGDNIEDDLAQEISNRLSKSIVQRMGSNKTLNSISKVCKATNGIRQLTEQFEVIFTNRARGLYCCIKTRAEGERLYTTIKSNHEVCK